MKAIIIPTEKNNWVKTYRIINLLLGYGVQILWNKETISEEEVKIAPGAFIIPLDDAIYSCENEALLQSLKALNEEKIIHLLESESIQSQIMELTISMNVVKLNPTRIALYQDSGCLSHAFVLSSSGFQVDWVTGMEIANGILDSYDVFMSGGGGAAKKANINRENLLLASMGIDGAKKVNNFVKSGGAYFGCCGGSYIGSVVRDRFMNWWHPAKRHMTMMNVEDWYINEYSDSGFKSPGQGVFIARNTAPKNPTMFGLPESFKCVHWNGPIWNLLEAAVENASSPTPLVEFEDVTSGEFTPSEFFKTDTIVNNTNIKNTGIHEACQRRKTAIAQGFYGTGLVVLSGSHPERITGYGEEYNKNELWDSARILCNASFWAPTISHRERKKSVKKYHNFIIPFKSCTEEIIQKLTQIKEKTIMLAKKGSKEIWLDKKLYSPSFGLTPSEMYNQNLDILPDLTEILRKELEILDELVDESKVIIEEIRTRISNTEDPNEASALKALMEDGASAILGTFHLMGKQKEPLWDQGGTQTFHGIHDQIGIAFKKFENAITRNDFFSKNRHLTMSETLDNPLTNTSSARTRLENALIITCVNESKLTRFHGLWDLYKK